MQANSTESPHAQQAQSRFLTAALEYARQGWPVFPLYPRTKKPLGKLVPNGFYDATTDEIIIRQWWAPWPDANVGIRCGEPLPVAVPFPDSDIVFVYQRALAVRREGMTARLTITTVIGGRPGDKKIVVDCRHGVTTGYLLNPGQQFLEADVVRAALEKHFAEEGCRCTLKLRRRYGSRNGKG